MLVIVIKRLVISCTINFTVAWFSGFRYLVVALNSNLLLCRLKCNNKFSTLFQFTFKVYLTIH